MAITSAAELLEKWQKNPRYRAEAKEIESIKKDIQTAKEHIADALARYRKVKLRARSKKKATENPFADLDGWDRRRDIQDGYGWGIITEKEMERLLNLWDLREQGEAADGQYNDRVTEMLETAMRGIGLEYADTLHEFREKCRDMECQAETIARENNQREWERKWGNNSVNTD